MDVATCKGCSTEYPRERRQQRYCTEACRKRSSNARWQSTHRPTDAAPSNPCTEPGCHRVRHSDGRCKMHHARTIRAQGQRVPSDTWTDRRRDNYHARRARLAGARNGDRALLSQVIERDGTECTACGLDVDLTLEWPDRMSKSIDHTVPLSRGGEHTLANTTLMHFGCNSSKGARVASTPT